MRSNPKTFFCDILLKNKLVTPDELRACLGRCTEDASISDLCGVLLADGIVPDKYLAAACKAIRDRFGPDALDLRSVDKGLAAYGPARAAASAPPAVAGAHPALPPVMSLSPLDVERDEAAAEVEPPTVGVDYLERILQLAEQSHASDLHVRAGTPPYLRIFGSLVDLDMPPLSPEDAERVVLSALPPGRRARFLRTRDEDFCYQSPELGRYRTNVFHDRNGFGLAMHRIPTAIPTLESLGLPGSLRKLLSYSQGMVLVTGPMGCGKSATLAALIHDLNRTRREHIITIEDPVEYMHPSLNCLVNHREAGLHTRSFSIALRAALREDPDIILVGEMRDLETISMAISAAETGHLVLGTLHTTNAAQTVDRMLDVFPPEEQPQVRAMLSESLRGIISQQLLPRKDGHGMVAAVEILMVTPAVAHIIRERRTFQLRSAMQTGRRVGMKTMDESLAELVNAKVITLGEGEARAEDMKFFRALLKEQG